LAGVVEPQNDLPDAVELLARMDEVLAVRRLGHPVAVEVFRVGHPTVEVIVSMLDFQVGNARGIVGGGTVAVGVVLIRFRSTAVDRDIGKLAVVIVIVVRSNNAKLGRRG
jgi:hypothetical protein